MAEYTKVKIPAGSEEEDAGFAADSGVGKSPCSNTFTMAAAGATGSQGGIGIFKSPQWVKPYNGSRWRYD
jgi:hypothetical protein